MSKPIVQIFRVWANATPAGGSSRSMAVRVLRDVPDAGEA